MKHTISHDLFALRTIISFSFEFDLKNTRAFHSVKIEYEFVVLSIILTLVIPFILWWLYTPIYHFHSHFTFVLIHNSSILYICLCHCVSSIQQRIKRYVWMCWIWSFFSFFCVPWIGLMLLLLFVTAAAAFFSLAVFLLSLKSWYIKCILVALHFVLSFAFVVIIRAFVCVCVCDSFIETFDCCSTWKIYVLAKLLSRASAWWQIHTQAILIWTCW